MWWCAVAWAGFSPAPDQTIVVPAGVRWLGLWAGDFDGDGDDDLLVQDMTQVPIYRYDLLLGGPAGLGSVPLPVPGSGSDLAVLDANGDGFDDYVEIDLLGSQMSLYLGGPSLPVAPVSVTPIGVASLGGVGDFDGDGFDDLALTDTDTPAGGAGHTEVYYGSLSGLSAVPDLELADNPSFVGATDVNGDGYDDVVRARSNALQVNAGGPGGVSPATTWSRSPGIATSLQYGVGNADLDGDGFEDFLVSGSWDVHLYRGSANGLRAPWLVPHNNGESAAIAIVPDVDADGDDEAVMGVSGLGAAPLVARGRAMLISGGTGVVATNVLGTAALDLVGITVAAGDFNGDGVSDWATQDGVGTLAVYLHP